MSSRDNSRCYFLGITVRRKPSPSWWERFRGPLRWAGIIVPFIATWSCLGWLISVQCHLQKNAGTTDQDTVWSFGEVLALATWAPFLFEFSYIWAEDPEVAMSGRLLAPYTVVIQSTNAEGRELDYRNHAVVHSPCLGGSDSRLLQVESG